MLKQIANLSFTILVAALFSFSCTTDTKKATSYNQFFEEHKEMEEFIGFNVPMFVAKAMILKEKPELKETVDKIKKIKVLMHDNKSLEMREQHQKDLMKVLEDGNYNDLAVVNESGQKITLKLLEEEGLVKEFLIVMDGEESNLIVVSVHGEMDKESMQEVAKRINLEDFSDMNIEFD